jgi:hypothetical protein
MDQKIILFAGECTAGGGAQTENFSHQNESSQQKIKLIFNPTHTERRNHQQYD